MTPRAIARRSKPQTRRIPYEPAIPTAAPPGATIESAVDAWVIISAGRKRSPGSATIHGGAKVTTLSAVDGDQGDDPRPRELLDDAPDVAVVGDPRQEEGEGRDDDGHAGGCGEDVSLSDPAARG